ncbi:choline dehydrogenase [Loktanella fryxellensis]|uniref:Choline dehydrogenase n=1 Tax=Loktanella fryxellensis TaxID=245187 RepID=A0A1H8CAR2_9RHOB|nr:GMC family oxidoreductase N-terminal domain-containing protein [Loktanella fryxellensis]SEM92145.1 choline dehydrogenase [Loktanella fryxellensis]
MTKDFDYIVVGGGSAGAVIAARLSEDATCRVALVEAGGTPPAREAMPAAVASLQLDPDCDWMFTADPGNAGLGLRDRIMPVPRGKMLGGSSGINYMAYVRGHPGDYDKWSGMGATGWSYADVLPYFKKSEDLAPSNEIVVDGAAHGTGGPLGVSVRSPVIPAARDFVTAAGATGIPAGDYNGRDRGGPAGVASLFQTSTRKGQRSSTYRAFLQGEAEARPNLTIITHAHVTQVTLSEGSSDLAATGIAYRDVDGTEHRITATREVILSAGAVGSPQILMLSGIGPRRELEAVDIPCRHPLPGVGKHLKDHLHCMMFFPAPGIGVPVAEIGVSAGPDALRAPAGPLPADPADDATLPPELAGLKAEAERRVTEWATTGNGLVSSSLYDAVAFYSTGLGDDHSHDAQIGFVPCGYDAGLLGERFRLDLDAFFDDPAKTLAVDAQNIILLANPVLPRSTGEIVLASNDPFDAPVIRMNYLTDPHDLKVMVAVMRKILDIVDNWPGPVKPGPLTVPRALAKKHGYVPGQPPSDALLENMALHYATTVYHLVSTCRIGDVVDADLRVKGVAQLRVADASVMPDIISGNTNAASIMIGEKAADLIAAHAPIPA